MRAMQIHLRSYARDEGITSSDVLLNQAADKAAWALAREIAAFFNERDIPMRLRQLKEHNCA